MTKHILTLILLLALTTHITAQDATAHTPKYVFYFIGDGMGMNQVNGTET